MRSRLLLMFCALVLIATGNGYAQVQTQAELNIPWNGYTPIRIPNNFTTIIGQSGTVSVNGGVIGDDQTYPITLPFNFRFTDIDVGPGTAYPTIWVIDDGYIMFNNPNGFGTFALQLNYATSGAYARMIIAWWNDMVIASGGGIFYRTDGNSGSQILTIEWRVGTWPSGALPGNLQVRIFQSGRIEWYFDHAPPTSGGSSTVAMATGIKYYGQPVGNPTGLNDATYQMLFNNPTTSPNQVAVTKLRTGSWSGNYYPEYTYELGLSAGAAPYFFLSTPMDGGQPAAFAATRVQRDIGATDLTFLPSVTGNAYSPGDTVTIRGTFKNIGSNSQTNVPVRADVYFNGNQLVVSRTGVISPGAYGNSSTITFAPTIGAVNTSTAGLYQVRLYSQLTGDEDNTNDTAYANFFIVKPNDVMAYDIQSPLQNIPPLFVKYPVGVGIPLEARFLNSGRNPQTNVPVGYKIFNAGGGLVTSGTATVSGTWQALQFRDIIFTSWTPQQPGTYYMKIFTMMPNDEEPTNDTLPSYPSPGKRFEVRYEIETEAVNAVSGPVSPIQDGFYPDGKPIRVRATFQNNGISDATNVPATVEIRDFTNTVVYKNTVSVLSITGDGGRATQSFPDFIPNGSGRYCATAIIAHAQDPLRGNDTVTWCFNVKSRLSGTIRVGLGERYRTIQEARDSLFYYGVSGPLTFELVDDNYLVQRTEGTTPALDFRGGVVGLGPTNPVVWRPTIGKPDVRVDLRSGSGIGVWYGQLDTSNPNGYINWDGGSTKALHFTFQNTGTANRALPFFFGQGASNYTIRNVRIDPVTGGGKLTATLIPMPSYTQAFNQFTFTLDQNLTASAGIMLRNSVVDLTGRSTRPDTLRNQNNTFDNNQISGFAYGILSVGAGPLFYLQTGGYQEFLNQTNHYTNNLIQDVSRGGIVVAYEKGSEISGNTIRRVINTSTTIANAAGIASTAGGNANNNRAYSTDLIIENNRIADIAATVGNGAGVSIETAEDVFISPTNTTWRFPGNSGATNMRVRNNMAWNYVGTSGTAGIALTQEATARVDFVTSGNRIENNTLYNQISAPTTVEYGIYLQRAGSTIKNNIIALVSPPGTALVSYGLSLQVPNYKQTVQSDYNLIWVPNGATGIISNLSTSGYPIPSPPAAITLIQWRALTGLDQNSVQGNVTTEFVSAAAGAVNLHINANIVGSLTSNRGTAIGDLTRDIDGDPRGTSPTGRYDIGADEFTGLVRNFDLAAEDIINPTGYRAASGQYSDAEYVMVARGPVPVRAIVRNVGGSPQLQNATSMQIERFNGSSWVTVNGTSTPAKAMIDVNATQTVDFGTFIPQTLQQVGQNDAFYGVNPNVTPLYRFRLSTGTDQFSGNDTLVKTVRFYIQQSERLILVAVKGFQAPMPIDAIGKSNKLNSDTLIAALNQINWSRADGVGTEDYDLFERDKWPVTGLNFLPWRTVVWAQGEEASGLVPEERVALKTMLSSGDLYNRKNLVMAGQEIARKHDVVLNATNGQVADQDFVMNILRADYTMNTTPADYSNRRIRGVAITPGKYELIAPTGVTGDLAPTPSALRVTTGPGIARATHTYVDQTTAGVDTMAGVTATASVYNSVYYAFDWRHAGRFQFEPTKSGAQRLLLGALDYIDQFRGILPVKLVSFDAYQSGRQAVTVEWRTASEVDVAGMEVERAAITHSETGLLEGAYRLVDRKVPAGTPTTGADYRVVDRGVQLGSEYRYRLVSVSLEGTRTLEETKLVKVLGAEAEQYELAVVPNPIHSNGAINYRVPAGEKVRLVLYDANGRVVRVLAEMATGAGSMVLPVAELGSGVYTVRLETARGVELTEKVTIEK